MKTAIALAAVTYYVTNAPGGITNLIQAILCPLCIVVAIVQDIKSL